MLTKQELLARQELGTYLEGLIDSQTMTKAEIKKAINIIIEGE